MDPYFKGAVCSTLDEVLSLNKLNWKNFTFRVLPEYLYSFKNGIYFHKNSPYIKPFDEIISSFQSAGLIEFWVSKYLDISYLNFKELTKAPKKLNLKELEGGIQLLIYGYSVSFLVFLLEIIYANRFKIASRLLKI